MGILICGLNGVGKSTLGKALAEKLKFHFIDIEDLYFDKNLPDKTYQNSRSSEEVVDLLREEVYRYPNFVLSSVKCDYGADILRYITHVILIEAPKEVRMKRIYDRSYEKFGERMLLGGDLYESENKFFGLVKSRPEDYVIKWLNTINMHVIKVDGTKPIEESVSYIISEI